MLNDEFFRQTVEDRICVMNEFVSMLFKVRSFLVTSMNLENALTEGLGKESADELIEQIATSNPCINDLDETNAQIPDQKEVIQNLFDYVAFDLGTHSIGGDDSFGDPDNE